MKGTRSIEARQSDFIRELLKKQKEAEDALERERASHKQDVAFLTRVVIAALLDIPGNRVTLSKYTPQDADFTLDENISGEMIIILGNTH